MLELNRKTGRVILDRPYFVNEGVYRSKRDGRTEVLPNLDILLGLIKRGAKPSSEVTSLIKIELALPKKAASLEEYAEMVLRSSGLKPYRHQVKSLAFALAAEKCGLFLEMGLGKTLVALGFVKALLDEERIEGALIVAPLSVIPFWVKEAKRFGIELTVLHGPKAKRQAKWNGQGSYVINYEGLRVMGWKPDSFKRFAVVLDESEKIKTPKAQVTRLSWKLFKYTPYKLILNGIPFTESPLEIYSQFRFLDPAFLGFTTYSNFKKRYAVFGGYMNYEVVSYQNIGELASRVRRRSVSYQRKDCIDLPPKVYEVRYVELPEKLRKLYDEMEKNYVIELRKNKITAFNVLSKLTKLAELTSGFVISSDKAQRIVSSPKLDELTSILPSLGKVIVWCRFREELAELRRAVRGCRTMDGSTSSEERKRILEWFDSVEKGVLGIEINVGKYGLNLQSASTAVYLSSSFSLSTRLQTEDRIYRIGSNGALIIDILAKDTVDEVIYEALKRKADVKQAFIEYLRAR